jgi:hypothetical protein
MITPKEIKAKCEKAFFRIVSAHLKGDNLFPWIIPSNKSLLGGNYSGWKEALIPLHQQSKAVKGKGFTVDWKTKVINGSKQNIPSRIYFETFEDFLHSAGRKEDYEKVVTSKNLVVSHFPCLNDWANSNPLLLLTNAGQWNEIIKVCQYFTSHPPPHPYYLRDLPIEVHSKFIEQNTGILKMLLDLLLPTERKNVQEQDFASRYFLKRVSVYTQIRILDDNLKPYLGFDECSLTLDDAAWLKWLPEKVFIIENQICFLTFPKVKNAVAIFGEGFKSRITKHLPWLEKTDLYCWFDLDTAGFEMLNMIREHYPNAKSFLMDEESFNHFAALSVHKQTKPKNLKNLTGAENAIYRFLLANNKRLEQEKINQAFVKIRLGH